MDNQSHQAGAPTKTCSYCAETVLAAAIVCKHCGRDLRTEAAAGESSPRLSSPAQPAAATNTYNPENSTGLWAMIWGFVGLFLPFLVLPPILALFLGVRGNKKVQSGLADNKGQSVTGIVLGAIGCALLALIVVPFGILSVTLALNSSTANTVNVPDVTGLTITQAESVLDRQGLVLGAQSSEASQKPIDTIVGQQPGPGEAIEEGGVVNVTVSSGVLSSSGVPSGSGVQSATQVPNVVGQSEDQARDDLVSDGLQVEVVYQRSETVPEGVVLEQDPLAGSDATQGTLVTLTVASRT